MSPRSPQLAWPLSLIGATVGAQLPAPLTSGVILALVLGLFGALVSGALERVRDWQVALMSPLTGAVTGATLGWSISSFDGAAIGFVAGIGFGLCALPPLVLITSARAARVPAAAAVVSRPGAAPPRVAGGAVDEHAGAAGLAGPGQTLVASLGVAADTGMRNRVHGAGAHRRGAVDRGGASGSGSERGRANGAQPVP